MEEKTQLKCACGTCGGVIEYLPQMAGQIIECPACKEKSRLPGRSPFEVAANEQPPPPLAPPRLCPACGANMAPFGSTCDACESKRRRNLKLIIGVASAVLVLGISWLFLRQFYAARKPQPQPLPPPGHMVLQPPRVKTPKSMKDFKIAAFGLESKRGSGLVLATGDIQNTSANLYLHIKADADLLDAKGVKIGTVSDEINELRPDMTWHFLATVKDPRAKSVRFASLKEIP